MTAATEKNLALVKETMTTAQRYAHAAGVLNFDMETICPSAAMEKLGEITAFFSTEAYKLVKQDAFIKAAEAIYEAREELPFLDRMMAESLHGNIRK